MIWRVVFFFAVFVTVTGGASIYVARRAAEVLPLAGRRTRVLAAVLFVSCMLPAIRFLGAETWAGGISTFGFAAGLACAGASVLLLAVDGVGGLQRLASRGQEPAPTSSQPVMPRRELLRRVAIGASLGAGASVSAYACSFGRHGYVMEEVPMRLARLPHALDGFVIAQLSDVHLGTFVGRREIAEARALIARTRPDLVVLTGDLVDHDPRYLTDLGILVRAMTEAGARHGVVAILGNHDDYTGGDDVTATLRAAGARVLRNDAMTIGDAGGRFALLGVDDVYAPRNGYGVGPNLAQAVAAAEPDLARVLLCHNPTLFTRASGEIDLQLSGHTHGGQINPGVTPVELIMPYVAGRYMRGDAQLYVNRGFGTAGPPARLGSAPEVTRIVLTT